MFVSRKNLALIHFVTGEVPSGLYVSQSAHQCVERSSTTTAHGVLLKPLSEGGVKRFAFRLRHQAGSLN
jgi:hypothetical protein